MLPLLLILFLGALGAQGGSPCPPRSELYPCACANVQGNRRRPATLVTCIGMKDSSSLEQVFNNALRTLEVDRLHILDSFWDEALGGSLPSDFFSFATVSEMEIADSRLSPCFACSGKTGCRNNLTTRISISNSSNSDRICSSCDGSSSSVRPQSWTGCMGSSLKEYRFSGGQLTSVGLDLFPGPMVALETLDLSNNRIAKIEPRALRNLPALKSLDLSRNAIELIDHVFGSPMPLLQHLDLSNNLIVVLGTDFFPKFPSLKRLLISNNGLRDMSEDVWEKRPESLKNIDLRGNPFHCDCTVRWLNASFPVGSEVRGDCASPPDYASSPLRQASRLLTTRCSPGGVMGTRSPSLRRNRKKTTKRP